MARRVSPPPTAPKLVHTRETIKAAISRLQKRLIEVEDFDPGKMQEKTPAEITALSSSIKTSLARAFGDNTEDYHRFSQAADIQWFEPPVFMAGMPRTPLSSYIEGVAYNRERSIAQLREAIKTLLEDYQEMDIFEMKEIRSAPDTIISRKIFIVHGRDNDAKNEVARFLSKIGLDEIILHERANKGRHLLTKFQEEAEGASFAVILLTPDDQGGLPGEELKKRARQNVVFEFGFFTGKIGPARVVALVKGDIEKPSDIDGLAYVSLDPTGAWKGLLARELSAAKIPFDPAKVFEA